jgi:excinuclease ABC subunit C
MPDDTQAVLEYLAHQRGGPVDLRVPVRGPKRALLRTVESNATDAFVRHRLHRNADHNSRARALESLQRELGLPDAPLRIECYDMSHLQGSDYVGSMVVFEDGLPKKSDYRHFRVTAVDGNDDYGAMEEVLTRRLTTLLKEEEAAGADGAATATRRRFAYPPQLLLLDGGIGQLNVGVRVLDALGMGDRIPIAALAKSFEEVYRPGDPEPIRLPRQSEALYLLQRVRDEAHRFAISYHRKLRGKRMTRGALDGVKGLGPKRQRRLLKEFGGLSGLRETSKDALVGVSWLPAEVGAAVFDRLHTPLSPARPARTGTVVDR